MKIVASLLFGALALQAAVAPAAAGAPGAACTLLTQGDLDGATGGKSGPANPMDQDVPGGGAQQVTMHACLWPITGLRGQVAVSMGPVPPGQSAQSLTKKNVGMDALRAQHYTEEAREFGVATCLTMTPPASIKDGLSMSVCSVVTKGQIVSVTYTSPGKKLSIEQTKALLDKAVARVH